MLNAIVLAVLPPHKMIDNLAKQLACLHLTSLSDDSCFIVRLHCSDFTVFPDLSNWRNSFRQNLDILRNSLICFIYKDWNRSSLRWWRQNSHVHVLENSCVTCFNYDGLALKLTQVSALVYVRSQSKKPRGSASTKTGNGGKNFPTTLYLVCLICTNRKV